MEHLLPKYKIQITFLSVDFQYNTKLCHKSISPQDNESTGRDSLVFDINTNSTHPTFNFTPSKPFTPFPPFLSFTFHLSSFSPSSLYTF